MENIEHKCGTCKHWDVKYAPSFGECSLNKRSSCYNDTCESYKQEDCFETAMGKDELLDFLRGFAKRKSL